MKWAFCCDDANVRFSVVLTTPSKEVVVVEAEHKVKGGSICEGVWGE